MKSFKTIDLVICSHNPREEFLRRTLESLQMQDFPHGEWRLTIIDNASESPIANGIDLSWHSDSRILVEPQLGLTNARLRAFQECDAEIIVWSDDDNLLAPDYLTRASEFMSAKSRVGIVGGRSIPEYEENPPNWYEPGLAPLGCRDLGDDILIAKADLHPQSYPAFAPIGAGMVSRREALAPWVQAVKNDGNRRALGRTGRSLTSGEDNDMNLTALKNGWDLAYLPSLSLIHLIPPSRLTLEYQKRIARASFRDFVSVLDLHGIRPWPAISPWTISARLFKTWLLTSAWRSAPAAIRLAGIRGQYEGRAKLRQQE